MDAQKKAELENAGINVDAALNRFMGKEAMLQKFFSRFLTDKSYAGLQAAMQNGDTETGKAAAHMLKSVCGTIGCENMQNMVINLETLLKAGNTDEADKLFPEIEAEYARINSALEKFLQA